MSDVPSVVIELRNVSGNEMRIKNPRLRGNFFPFWFLYVADTCLKTGAIINKGDDKKAKMSTLEIEKSPFVQMKTWRYIHMEMAAPAMTLKVNCE